MTGLRLALLLMILGSSANAAEARKAVKPAPQKDAVIDFEAEVIEGERLRPEIFVQMGSQEQQMSPVLYLRRHFNDFHFSDRKWRPGYFESGFVQKPAPKGRKDK